MHPILADGRRLFAYLVAFFSVAMWFAMSRMERKLIK